MADKMPDYRISQQRLLADIAALEARRESHKLSLLELVSRRDSILANWEAEETAITTKREELASLQKAHGAITAALIEEASTGDLTGGKVADLEEDQNG